MQDGQSKSVYISLNENVGKTIHQLVRYILFFRMK